jgi:hypothetical protein
MPAGPAPTISVLYFIRYGLLLACFRDPSAKIIPHISYNVKKFNEGEMENTINFIYFKKHLKVSEKNAIIIMYICVCSPFSPKGERAI